jgi:hypothetical protein
LQPGGATFIQARQSDPRDVWANIPEYARRIIRRNNVRVLYLDAAAIAREVATEPDLAGADAGHRAARRLSQGDALPAGAPVEPGRIDGGRGKEPAQILSASAASKSCRTT